MYFLGRGRLRDVRFNLDNWGNSRSYVHNSSSSFFIEYIEKLRCGSRRDNELEILDFRNHWFYVCNSTSFLFIENSQKLSIRSGRQILPSFSLVWDHRHCWLNICDFSSLIIVQFSDFLEIRNRRRLDLNRVLRLTDGRRGWPHIRNSRFLLFVKNLNQFMRRRLDRRSWDMLCNWNLHSPHILNSGFSFVVEYLEKVLVRRRRQQRHVWFFEVRNSWANIGYLEFFLFEESFDFLVTHLCFGSQYRDFCLIHEWNSHLHIRYLFSLVFQVLWVLTRTGRMSQIFGNQNYRHGRAHIRNFLFPLIVVVTKHYSVWYRRWRRHIRRRTCLRHCTSNLAYFGFFLFVK